MNNDRNETSLLGKEDAVRLGVVTMKLEGANKEHTMVNRIRQNKKLDFPAGQRGPQNQKNWEIFGSSSENIGGGRNQTTKSATMEDSIAVHRTTKTTCSRAG